MSQQRVRVRVRSVNVDRRIALALRRDPKLIGVFESRLRSKMATARSTAALGDDDWEWYVILTLWSPLQVIKLLEDSSEQANTASKDISASVVIVRL
jgi:hypothetical protein